MAMLPVAFILLASFLSLFLKLHCASLRRSFSVAAIGGLVSLMLSFVTT
jgi:hypothetical protein